MQTRNAPAREPTLGKGWPRFGNKRALQTTRIAPKTEPTRFGNVRPVQTSQNFPKTQLTRGKGGFLCGSKWAAPTSPSLPETELTLGKRGRYLGSEHATQASRITPRALLRGRAAQTSQSIKKQSPGRKR